MSEAAASGNLVASAFLLPKSKTTGNQPYPVQKADAGSTSVITPNSSAPEWRSGSSPTAVENPPFVVNLDDMLEDHLEQMEDAKLELELERELRLHSPSSPSPALLSSISPPAPISTSPIPSQSASASLVVPRKSRKSKKSKKSKKNKSVKGKMENVPEEEEDEEEIDGSELSDTEVVTHSLPEGILEEKEAEEKNSLTPQVTPKDMQNEEGGRDKNTPSALFDTGRAAGANGKHRTSFFMEEENGDTGDKKKRTLSGNSGEEHSPDYYNDDELEEINDTLDELLEEELRGGNSVKSSPEEFLNGGIVNACTLLTKKPSRD